MARISCTKCHCYYPVSGVPFCCPSCGGLFDWEEFPEFSPEMLQPSLPGFWKYRQAFGLPLDAPVVTLGEGNTALVEDDYRGHKIVYKLECLNPSGSYKDRGSAVLLSFLLSRGVLMAVEDSSGNAGASFAAYASRACLKARIFIPAYAAGPKRRQIEIYGAEMVIVDGPRSAAAKAVRQEAEGGAIYASHAFLPVGMPGIATIAYEIAEQLGAAPGTIVAPVGHGSLLLGVMRGFKNLKHAGIIQELPYFVGVQAKRCAPVWMEFTHQAGDVSEGNTVAEGVRVRDPLRGKAILDEFDKHDFILAIDEERIIPCRDELARRGVYVEPTSALAWAALEEIAGKIPEPVVLILSGSGMKYER